MSELRSLMEAFIEKGTITCTDCFVVARKAGTPLRDVGSFCNEHGIRIGSCQLGCFE